MCTFSLQILSFNVSSLKYEGRFPPPLHSPFPNRDGKTWDFVLLSRGKGGGKVISFLLGDFVPDIFGGFFILAGCNARKKKGIFYHYVHIFVLFWYNMYTKLLFSRYMHSEEQQKKEVKLKNVLPYENKVTDT